MNTLIKRIDAFLSVLLTLMVAILATGVIATVFMRYFFSLSYGWFEEFLTMLFVAITFLGSAACIREKQHIGITIVTDTFSGLAKTISSVFIESVYIAVSAFLLVYSLKWIGHVGSTLSPSSGIPFGLYYSVVPIASGFSIFYASVNIAGLFISIPEPITGYFNDEEILQEG